MQEQMKKSSRGGKRVGAGRKKAPIKKVGFTVYAPEAMVPELKIHIATYIAKASKPKKKGGNNG